MSILKSNKTLHLLKYILEIVWLIVALLALGIAIRETLSFGFTKNMLYYAFSTVGFFFYFSRRKQRKSAE
jgi:hypothetical protein